MINNLNHISYETVGKIYYIQSYFNGSITQNVPYRVIGKRHENTIDTLDLMSMVSCTSLYWHNKGGWDTGKYSTSGLYSWTPNTCPNGYSNAIKSKMCYMTERWREATGNNSGSLQTRQTQCKLLNPWELSGTSIQADCSDFNSSYGSFYEDAFSNTTSADPNKIRYSDLSMTTAVSYWSNSYYLHNGYYARIFLVEGTGQTYQDGTDHAYAICPVIRLSNNPT